ncbi:hypothetical protein H0E87_030326 [Populus deltoides]|uniref:Homeodomain-like protein n=1 Tax=Populus deltoides TaxID=3696 RepID=A0A8T2WJC4_POPDE|nr:hypothetical protein H0E87_030326 [Populus deltoides]
MVKATLVDKNGLRKGAWSKEEDDKLRVYVQKYGHWNWRQLPRFAEQSSETSQSEDSLAEKSETESVSVNTPSEPDRHPKIVENIPSPQEISCSELSSMNNDYVSGMNGAADSFSPMEIFQDSGFWNQPFIADNNDSQDGYHSLLFTEEVYMPSYPFNYDDDSTMNWIQQMMQELQDSN